MVGVVVVAVVAVVVVVVVVVAAVVVVVVGAVAQSTLCGKSQICPTYENQNGFGQF